MPGILQYVQNQSVPGVDGAEPPYAGVGEVWFADMDAAAAALASPEWRAVMEDATSFMDMDTVFPAPAEVHVVLTR